VPRHVALSYVYYFDGRLDPDDLCHSLGELLSGFPFLAGRLVRTAAGEHDVRYDGGAVSFVVEDDDRPMPRRASSDGTKQPFGATRNSIPFWRVALAGQPLFRARLSRYADGSALAVSISHALVDMHSFCALMDDWAGAHRGATRTPPGERGLPWPANSREHSALREHFLHFNRIDALRTTARFARGGLDCETRTVHFTQSELAGMRGEAQRTLETGEWISTNDALAAHLWSELGALRRFDRGTASVLTSIVNLRQCGSRALAKTYFGNATLAIPATLAEDGSAGLSRRAAAVRGSIRRLDDERIGGVIAYLESRARKDDLRGVWPRMDVFESDLWINNWSKFGIYEVDFGAGKPSWFDMPNVPIPWFSLVLPAPPAIGGVDVHLSLPRAAACELGTGQAMRRLHAFA